MGYYHQSSASLVEPSIQIVDHRLLGSAVESFGRFIEQ